MSETPIAGTGKIVYHENGHLKRIDTSTLEKGDYAYSIDNGNITIKQIESSVKPSSFKDASGSILIPTSPFLPVVQNKDGFSKLALPQTQDNVCGIVNKGSTGFISQDITGVNVITQQYKLAAPTDSVIYCYDKVKKNWKALDFVAGSYVLQADSSGLNPVKLTPKNFYQHMMGLPISSNIFTLQFNKGEINNVVIPSTQGNYCLRVDDKGDVSFGTGETQERLCVTFKLSAKTGKRPTLGEQLIITSGDENVEMDSTYMLKTNTRFFVDATFNFLINNTSVFDSQEQAASILFKIGSDDTNIIDKNYVFHPETGVLRLHFTGISKQLISETPHLCLQCDSIFNALGVNLSFCDPSYLGSITFIEV